MRTRPVLAAGAPPPGPGWLPFLHSGSRLFGSGRQRGPGASRPGRGQVKDTKVGLYGLNVYYDFDSGGLLPFSFTPFIGAGVGLADVEGVKNKERALSVHLRGQFSFSDSGAYVGLKGSYYHINGPVKNRPVDHYVVGLKYDDVGVFTALVTLGYRF